MANVTVSVTGESGTSGIGQALGGAGFIIRVDDNALGFIAIIGTTSIGDVTLPGVEQIVSVTSPALTGSLGDETIFTQVFVSPSATVTALSGSVGTVTIGGGVTTTIPVTGVSSTSALGSVTLPGIETTVPVTLAAATGSVDDLTINGDANIPSSDVGSVSATTSLGSVRLVSAHAVGVAATGAVKAPFVKTQITSTSPITFTVNQGETTVRVNDPNSDVTNGELVEISDVFFGHGLSTPYDDLAELLTGSFTVTNVVNTSTYEFELPSASPQGVIDSGFASIVYEIDPGLDIVIKGTGWGAGSWSRGTWGSAANISAGDILRVWKHDNFGEDLIYNVRDGGIYYWDATKGVTSRGVDITTLDSNAPTVARQVLVSDRDRHVIAVGANPVGETQQDKLLIRFSDQENPFDWLPTSTNTAGDLRIGNGSEIMQAIETRREVVVLTDSSVHSLQYIGEPFTFGVTQLSNQTTTMGVNAAVAVGDAVFWMGVNRFYVYDGRVQPLPCTVRDYVFEDFNEDQADKVFAGSNAAFGEVFWFYPSASNAISAGGTGENDRYVVYNYEQKIWYVGNLERTAWVDRGLNQYPIATTSATNPTIPYKMYDHERGVDADGIAFTAFIESAPVDIGDGDNFTFIRRMIPDVDFGKSDATATKEATVTLKAQRFPGTGFTSSKALTVTDTTEQNHTRLRGRSFGLRIESDNLGVAWRLGSPRLEIQQDGKR